MSILGVIWPCIKFVASSHSNISLFCYHSQGLGVYLAVRCLFIWGGVRGRMHL